MVGEERGNGRSFAAPLPEVVGSGFKEGSFVRYRAEGCVMETFFGTYDRSVVEGDFEEDELDDDHKAGLKKEGVTVVCAEPVEDSNRGLLLAGLCSLFYSSVEDWRTRT